MNKNNDDIRSWFNNLRNVNESMKNGTLINESEEDNDGAVPYTKQDTMMAEIIKITKSQFGADFSTIKNPLLYHPNNGNVTLNGTITDFNDCKFTFSYKDESGAYGCKIWCNPLQLSDKNLKKLQVIYGVFENWRKEISASEDIKPMSLKNK